MLTKGFFESIHWHWGILDVTGSVLQTWVLMALLGFGAWAVTRRLSRTPGNGQVLLETLVQTLEDGVEGVLPGKREMVFPFIATLWVFIFSANMMGLVPGFSSPTADLSVTSALACLVFGSVHWFGIRVEGWRGYLHHYLKPNPMLLPFHLISEVSRTLALAVRLFGNMMSLEMTAVLALLVAGFLVPVPLLMLHIVEAVIQAYLFGTLALIYIASALQLQESRIQKAEA
jgi:F-type H+-transporting ATPase subunit a